MSGLSAPVRGSMNSCRLGRSERLAVAANFPDVLVVSTGSPIRLKLLRNIDEMQKPAGIDAREKLYDAVDLIVMFEMRKTN